MRSLLGRFHRPFARSADEQLLLMNNLGDGSTLSLDFTTMGNTLDPRLTFTRSTNATFINSQGLVQYAGQNLYFNTAFGGLSGTNPSLTSSGWTYAFSTGSATFHGDGSVTMTASSQRIGISRSSGFTGAGRRVIASVDILTVGDTGLTPSNLLITGTYTNGAHYVNSSLYTTGNVIGPCTLSFVFDSPTSGTTGAYFGVGMSGNSTATVKFANPRLNLWNGVVPAPYLENTSTTAERHDPRFDHDPTSIGTPRGLLIEGSANNLLTYSEDYSQAVWTKVTVDRTTGQASPDGGTGATLLSENATTYAKHDIERTQSISAGVHTFSVWVKEPSSNSRRYVCLQLADGQATAARYTIVADLQTGQITASGSVNGTAGAPTNTGHSITPYPGGWYRLTITMNFVSSPCYPVILLSDTSTLFVGNNQPFYSATTPYKGLIVWGAMLEQGSGASSYIPTGASTGSRAADNLEVTGTNFSSWWPNPTAEFTVQWVGDLVRSPATSQFIWLSRAGGSSKARNYVQTNSVIRGNSSVVDFTMSPATTATVGVVFKTAMAVKSGDSAMYVNNGTTIGNQADATSGTTTNHDSLYFNPNADNFMHLKQFKFWPLRLPNATLLALVS